MNTALKWHNANKERPNKSGRYRVVCAFTGIGVTSFDFDTLTFAIESTLDDDVLAWQQLASCPLCGKELEIGQ